MKGIAALTVSLAIVVAACAGSAEQADTVATSRAPITTTLSPQDLSTTTTAPAATVPKGFIEYEGDGFSMLLPERWDVAGFGELNLAGLFDEFSNSGYDELIPIIESTFAQGGKMFAFDFENASPTFVDNINILRLDPLKVQAGEVLKEAERQIKAIGGQDVVARADWVPAGETIIVNYMLPADLGGGEGISYTILTPSSQWVVTYTARETDTFRSGFEMMMESFREG